MQWDASHIKLYYKKEKEKNHYWFTIMISCTMHCINNQYLFQKIIILQRNQLFENLPFTTLIKSLLRIRLQSRIMLIFLVTFLSPAKVPKQSAYETTTTLVNIYRRSLQKRVNLEWVHTFREEHECHLLQNSATNLALLPSHLFPELLWLVKCYNHCWVGSLLGRNCDL